MKISFNWLRDFIEITEPDSNKIKDTITACTAEVETMETLGSHLDNIVVGKIERVEAHPNADSLRITYVNDGNESLKIVCGGANLEVGMKVALAKIGQDGNDQLACVLNSPSHLQGCPYCCPR